MTDDQNATGSSRPPQKAKPRILFIEDDEILVNTFQTKLTVEGFEVATAENGYDALNALETANYDLVLLDIMLPDADGLAILERLRASSWPNAKKPVIVFSNLGRQADIDKAIKIGANDYLIKTNLTPNQVVEKIRQHLQ